MDGSSEPVDRSARALDPSRDDCDGEMTDLATRVGFRHFHRWVTRGRGRPRGIPTRTRARRPGAHTVARARRGRSDARDDAEEARARPREARGGIRRRRERPVVDDPRRDSRAGSRVPSFARTSGRERGRAADAMSGRGNFRITIEPFKHRVEVDGQVRTSRLAPPSRRAPPPRLHSTRDVSTRVASNSRLSPPFPAPPFPLPSRTRDLSR